MPSQFLKISIYLLIQLLITSVKTKHYTENYLWRDYEGVITSDAFPANKPNQTGKPVFIGQALYDGKLVPGKINIDDGKVCFELFEKEYSANENVKILCCQRPESLKWIPASSNALRSLRENKLLVKGGYEPKCESYIGRVELNGEMHPGKVICFKVGAIDVCFGLFTTHNGTTQLHQSYEILGFNENPDAGSTAGIDGAGMKGDRCKNTTINLFS